VDLRYQLAVVAGAGGGVGRAVAVALSRRGAAVLVADADRRAAEDTARLVGAARVATWVVQADVRDGTDRRLVMQRAADLGGADLLVDAGAAGPELTALFVAGLAERRGRPDVSPAAVRLGPDPWVAPPGAPVRLMAVDVGPLPLDDSRVAALVVDLLAHGADGQVVRAG
jgi:NAD(P)-dependent dehydrogenase (short-subunit alcohol dehydrogenase family)